MPGNHVSLAEWRRSEEQLPFSFKNHASWVYNGVIYIFGGYDGRGNNNEIRMVDLRTLRYLGMLETEGDPPVPRNGHTATLVGQKVYVIGGWTGRSDLASDDVFTLDLESRLWERPAFRGHPPGPCNMHTATYFPEREVLLVVRGGDGRLYLSELHELHIPSQEWRRVETLGPGPSPRANHAATRFGSTLFVFGGWNGVHRFADLHVLDTTSWTWSEVEPPAEPIRPRAGCCAGVLDDYAIFFGGSGSRGRCYDDLDMFHIPTMKWAVVRRAASREEASTLRAELMLAGEENRAEGKDAEGKEGEASWGGRARSGSAGQRGASSGSAGGHGEGEGDPHVVVGGSDPGQLSGHTGSEFDGALVILGGSAGARYLTQALTLHVNPAPPVLCRTPHPLSFTRGRESGLAPFVQSSQFSDITLEVQGRRFPAHRLVLAAGSEHFNALLSSGFREADQGEVSLEGVGHRVFSFLLCFLYTGTCDPLEGALTNDSIADTLELLHLADVYVIPSLKEQCEVFLQRAVDADTAPRLLKRAELANARQLADYCRHVLTHGVRWDML